MPQIRHEINIINQFHSVSATTLTANGIAQLDRSQYNGTVTYFFEIVANVTNAAGTKTVTLRRNGTSTDDATITVSNTAGYSVLRSAAFTNAYGNFGAQEYVAFLTATGSGTLSLKAARIVIIQNSPIIFKAESQIEIGASFATTATSDTVPTPPKYWTYRSANWNGKITAYFEATILTTAGGTTTCTLQSSNGAFQSWANVTNSAVTTTSTSASRVRSAALILTAGADYRIVLKTTAGATATVYNAKMVIDQIETLCDGLISWHKLDDGTGSTAVDSAGGGNNTGTLISGANWTNGIVNGCVSFTGTSGQHVSIPDSSGIRADFVTLSAWFNSTGFAAAQCVLSKPQNAAPWSSPFLSWMIRINSTSSIEMDVGNAGTYSAASFSVSPNLLTKQWYHIALTYTGSLLTAYLTGKALGTSATVTNKIIYGSGIPFLIGANNSAAPRGDYFNGYIDDVRVYNRNLTDIEITGLSLNPAMSGITKLETQYLLANTGFAAGTGAQDFKTQYNAYEWSGCGTVFRFAADSRASGSFVDLLLITPSGAVANSEVIPITGQAVSSGLAMVTGGVLDCMGVKNSGDISAARIIVEVTLLNTTIPPVVPIFGQPPPTSFWSLSMV